MKSAQSKLLNCHLFDQDTLDALELIGGQKLSLAGGSGVPELDEVDQVWLGVGDWAKKFSFTTGCALVLSWETGKGAQPNYVWVPSFMGQVVYVTHRLQTRFACKSFSAA